MVKEVSKDLITENNKKQFKLTNNSGKKISLPITATGYPRRIDYNKSVKKVLKNVTQT